MGRGGNEIDPRRLLYGEPLVSRLDRRVAPAGLETVFPEELFGAGELISATLGGESYAATVDGPAGRRFLFSRRGQPSELRVLPDELSAPQGPFEHQSLPDNLDMFLWKDEEEDEWNVMTCSDNGDPGLRMGYSSLVGNSEYSLTTIKGFPGLAWIELRGSDGLCLQEADKRSPKDPAMVVSSYPCDVSGETDNVKAIYNPRGAEIIAVWSEAEGGQVRIRSWGSQTGTETIALYPGDQPARIEDLQLQDDEPVFTFSTGEEGGSLVYAHGEFLKMGPGHGVPKIIACTDGRILSARRSVGELLVEEISGFESGLEPKEVARISNVDDYELTGKSKPKLIYKRGGKNPLIMRVDLDGVWERPLAELDAGDLLGATTDNSGKTTALVLDRSSDRPQVISLEDH